MSETSLRRSLAKYVNAVVGPHATTTLTVNTKKLILNFNFKRETRVSYLIQTSRHVTK